MSQFFDKEFVPKNVEELYNSGWKDYLLYNIRAYNLNDVNNSPEDILQDMMLQMIKYNFLESFDPERTEFIRYIKTFVRFFMAKVYNKEHKTQHGEAITHRASIVPVADEDDCNSIGYDSLGSIGNNFEDYICLKESIEQDLLELRAEHNIKKTDDFEFKKDAYTVFKLLLAGYEVKEIAETFGTSKQHIYNLKKTILNFCN